jgi:hypothetical protein
MDIIAVWTSQERIPWTTGSISNFEGLVMLHDGERIVEVVQQALPFAVLGGLAKSDGMIFERAPTDE